MFGAFAFAQAYFAGVVEIFGRARRGIGGSGLPPGWNPAALIEQAAADEELRRRLEAEERDVIALLEAGLL